MTFTHKITELEESMSIKEILRNQFRISSRFMTKLKLNQKIFINDKVAKINEIPKVGDTVTVMMDFEEEDTIKPQPGDLQILYEDEYFLAVYKPANMVVHPSAYHLENTLANYVKYYLNNHRKIRPINRLDNGTSGVVLFAKNEYMQELFKNMPSKPIKEYIAVTYGVFDKKEGVITLPIARKEGSIIEREVNFETGQTAITRYEVLREYEIGDRVVSVLKVHIETGRTHQIRVHMSAIGHPIVGDTLYAEADCLSEIGHQALHAYKLSFEHPITKQKLEIIAPLPEDILKILPLDFLL